MLRLYDYSVISLPISVIYFGGYHTDKGPNDIVAEYKNLKWNDLGNLASPRYGHRSVYIRNKIFIIGGANSK